MNSVREIEVLKMSCGEKARLRQWLMKDLSDAAAGSESRPDVCGGAAYMAWMRIPVWLLENARRNRSRTSAKLSDFNGAEFGERLGLRSFALRRNRTRDNRK